MTKVLVLYYSSYGHIEQMADAVAEGARAGGADVDIRRVAETAPKAVVESAHFKTDTAHAEIEGPDALKDYDAIIVGAPTRFGRMPAQMASFWDTTGGLWFSGALVGKVGGAFTSTASQHGGQRLAAARGVRAEPGGPGVDVGAGDGAPGAPLPGAEVHLGDARLRIQCQIGP